MLNFIMLSLIMLRRYAECRGTHTGEVHSCKIWPYLQIIDQT
jgi:hypothetical protein